LADGTLIGRKMLPEVAKVPPHLIIEGFLDGRDVEAARILELLEINRAGDLQVKREVATQTPDVLRIRGQWKAALFGWTGDEFISIRVGKSPQINVREDVEKGRVSNLVGVTQFLEFTPGRSHVSDFVVVGQGTQKGKEVGRK
jgi:hypothetical protein